MDPWRWVRANCLLSKESSLRSSLGIITRHFLCVLLLWYLDDTWQASCKSTGDDDQTTHSREDSDHSRGVPDHAAIIPTVPPPPRAPMAHRTLRLSPDDAKRLSSKGATDTSNFRAPTPVYIAVPLITILLGLCSIGTYRHWKNNLLKMREQKLTKIDLKRRRKSIRPGTGLASERAHMYGLVRDQLSEQNQSTAITIPSTILGLAAELENVEKMVLEYHSFQAGDAMPEHQQVKVKDEAFHVTINPLFSSLQSVACGYVLSGAKNPTGRGGVDNRRQSRVSSQTSSSQPETFTERRLSSPGRSSLSAVPSSVPESPSRRGSSPEGNLSPERPSMARRRPSALESFFGSALKTSAERPSLSDRTPASPGKSPPLQRSPTMKRTEVEPETLLSSERSSVGSPSPERSSVSSPGRRPSSPEGASPSPLKRSSQKVAQAEATVEAEVPEAPSKSDDKPPPDDDDDESSPPEDDEPTDGELPQDDDASAAADVETSFSPTSRSSRSGSASASLPQSPSSETTTGLTSDQSSRPSSAGTSPLSSGTSAGPSKVQRKSKSVRYSQVQHPSPWDGGTQSKSRRKTPVTGASSSRRPSMAVCERSSLSPSANRE